MFRVETFDSPDCQGNFEELEKAIGCALKALDSDYAVIYVADADDGSTQAIVHQGKVFLPLSSSVSQLYLAAEESEGE